MKRAFLRKVHFRTFRQFLPLTQRKQWQRMLTMDSSTCFDMFHTELKELFRALNYRKNKKGLRRLMETDEGYRHLEADTVKVMSVLMNAPRLWEDREKYMSRKEEKEEYDMCQALREWIEDERRDAAMNAANEGRKEGIKEGIRSLVVTCVKFDISREDIIFSVMEQFDLTREKAEEFFAEFAPGANR